MQSWIKRRNWRDISIERIETSFAILLDDNFLLTPKKNQVLLPTEQLALAVAEEWRQQEDKIQPFKMPYSKLINSAIDTVKENFESILVDLLNYGDTDLVCYRAEGPEELMLLQKTSWDPILFWAKTELGIELRSTQGITYKPQDAVQRQKLLEEIKSYNAFYLTGFYDLVTISGSMLIALAVCRAYISPEVGLSLSFLDEDWQRKKWGEDEESITNKSNKLKEFQTAYQFLKLLT